MNDDHTKSEPKETPKELKEQVQDGILKKGYNEANPTQPGGSFVPDGKDVATPDEAPKESK